MNRKQIKGYLYRLKNILRNRESLYFKEVFKRKITLGNPSADWTVSIEDIKPESIVYSFGVGQDISFDMGLMKRFGVSVHAFDPSPGAISWLKNQAVPEGFHFHAFGLGGKNGEVKFGFTGKNNSSSATILEDVSELKDNFAAEIKTLKTIMKELNHTKIDILKMDIEGAEYEVIDNFLAEGIQIQQLLVEFHHRFRNVGISSTRKAVKALRQAGFRIFHISPSGEEISFYNVRMAGK